MNLHIFEYGQLYLAIAMECGEYHIHDGNDMNVSIMHSFYEGAYLYIFGYAQLHLSIPMECSE